MRKTTIFLVLFVYLSILQAQNHDNIWMVGVIGNDTFSTVLNFNNGSGLQVDTVVRNMPILRTCVSMSDSIGSLIFYSNGIKINNSQYQLMQNGDSLNPGQAANDFRNSGYPLYNAIISVPHPIQTNQYYMFHISASYALQPFGMAEYLYYTEIDMNANNGLGRVESKNNILASDSIANGQLQMVKHANGYDWWLVQPIAWSNGYYIFLVKEDTIELAHKQYIGNPPIASGQEWMGQSVFSPNGSKYARYDFKNDLDILDFDRCTGLFSNPIHIPIQDTIDVFGGTNVGVAISPSSQYLYVSSYNFMYQFDLWSSNIAASKDTVAVYDGFVDMLPTTFSFMQLGSDSNIYVLANYAKYTHVISNPDLGGISCNVQQHSLSTYHYSGTYLPNFPHYRTPALSIPCDTTTNVVGIVEEEKWEILLYPNPTNNQINIQSNVPLTSNIEIYNSLGQLISIKLIENEASIITIDASSLMSGIYIMRLKNGENTITKSFIVSK